MSDYDNELRGAIFQVEKDRRRHEKSPTHQGECEIRGRKYRIAGWRNTSKAGRPYLSLKFTDAEDDQERRDRAKRESQKPLERNPGEDEGENEF